jgi:hypothetical protein
MRLLPSGEKLTHRTVPVCALRMVERPSLQQHEDMHRAAYVDEFEQGQAVDRGSCCPATPVPASQHKQLWYTYTVGCQRRTVLSFEPDAMRL